MGATNATCAHGNAIEHFDEVDEATRKATGWKILLAQTKDGEACPLCPNGVAGVRFLPGEPQVEGGKDVAPVAVAPEATPPRGRFRVREVRLPDGRTLTLGLLCRTAEDEVLLDSTAVAVVLTTGVATGTKAAPVAALVAPDEPARGAPREFPVGVLEALQWAGEHDVHDMISAVRWLERHGAEVKREGSTTVVACLIVTGALDTGRLTREVHGRGASILHAVQDAQRVMKSASAGAGGAT